MSCPEDTRLADAEQAYHDNADWQESYDLVKARLFVTACRRILGLKASNMNRADAGLTFQLSHINTQLMAAEDWIKTQPGGFGTGVPNSTGVSVLSFRGMQS